MKNYCGRLRMVLLTVDSLRGSMAFATSRCRNWLLAHNRSPSTFFHKIRKCRRCVQFHLLVKWANADAYGKFWRPKVFSQLFFLLTRKFLVLLGQDERSVEQRYPLAGRRRHVLFIFVCVTRDCRSQNLNSPVPPP